MQDGGLLSDIPAVDDEFGTGKMSAVGEYGHAVILSHPETDSSPFSVTMPVMNSGITILPLSCVDSPSGCGGLRRPK